MIHLRSAAFFCLLSLFLAHCSPAESPALPSATAEKAPAGSVWVASAPNGGRIYLCGTIHILREADYPLAPAYEAAYADSKKLVFELPPGTAENSNAKMQELAALPDGQTLESLIGPEMTATVTAWAAKNGIPKGSIIRFQPWYIALMIAAVEYNQLGAQPDKGVDNYFEARATRDKKPGEGLETVDFQIGLFTRLTAAQQKDLLKQTLSEVKTMSADFTKLLQAWKQGDLDALHEMLYHEAEQYPELLDLFLLDRNKAWITRLDEFLKKGDHVMLLVGTAHLTGKQGLIELLKARGYTVERYHSAAAK